MSVNRYKMQEVPWDAYTPTWRSVEDAQGEFVYATDYDALLASHERLRAAVEQAQLAIACGGSVSSVLERVIDALSEAAAPGDLA